MVWSRAGCDGPDVLFIYPVPPTLVFCCCCFRRGEKDTNTKTELSLPPRLRLSLPPSPPLFHHSSAALPLLSCDVFWPDSMAPGRQWHDHRNRGQQGHSSLFGVFRKWAGAVQAWLTAHSTFRDSGLTRRLQCPYQGVCFFFNGLLWVDFFFFFFLTSAISDSGSVVILLQISILMTCLSTTATVQLQDFSCLRHHFFFLF